MRIAPRHDDGSDVKAFRAAGAVFAACLALLAPTVAAARNDEAPAPRRSPRELVVQQPLAIEKKPALPPARSLSGTASILDTEKLRLGDTDLRLFGVVAPQLSAPFGPQTRAVLDALAAEGPTQCAVRDRDREGRLLATCRSANGTDFALELLKRGLAVTARGSLRTSDLGASYVAAEQAAQAQRSGLWSVAAPAAASDAAIREAAARDAKEKAEDAQRAQDKAQDKAREEERRKEAEKAAAPPAAPAPAAPASSPTESAAAPSPRPVIASLTGGTAPPEAAASQPPAPPSSPSVAGAPISISPVLPPAPPVVAGAGMPDAGGGFLARYQLLLTGILMVFSSFAIFFGLGLQRWMDRRESLRALAAALRGELMAARALCLSRLRALAHDTENRHVAWPRVRVLVFQAHVGRLGELGADLARQIASIYGQASDYAAYYAASGDPSAAPVSKRQALLTLAQHIEEVLPRLVWIEQHGRRAPSATPAPAGAVLSLPTSPGGPGTSLPAPETPTASEASSDAKDATAAEEEKAPPAPTSRVPEPEKADAPKATREDKLADAPFVEEKPARAKPRPDAGESRKASGRPAPSFPSAAAAATGAATRTESGTEAPAAPPSPLLPLEPADGNDSTPPLWSALRRMASKPFETRREHEDPDAPPDYTALSDEEIEALAYSAALLEEEDTHPVARARRAR